MSRNADFSLPHLERFGKLKLALLTRQSNVDRILDMVTLGFVNSFLSNALAKIGLLLQIGCPPFLCRRRLCC